MRLAVCHICPSFNNALYSQITDRQIEDNIDVKVFYFRKKGQELINGDKPYVYACTPFNNFDRYIFHLKEHKVSKLFFSHFDVNNFDIIHAHTLFTSGYIALKAKELWNIPYVVAVRGSDINVFFKKRILLRSIGQKILRKADAIVFISPSARDEVLNNYIRSYEKELIENKTFVIPNGIDNFWLKNSYLKKNNEIDKRIIKLIYYGDINKNKNIITSIKAAELLIKDGYKIIFYIAGELSNSYYKQLIEEKSFIKYLGFLPKEKLIDYLRESDIFIMPSYSESFGLSYVEAMSQSIPVIYTEKQGFDNRYKEGTVGFHVNPDSPEEIKNRIINILEDFPHINDRCKNISQEYNWDAIVDQYKNIYTSIMK
ncbi:MAG: glycosyltransferase family 4 protein [Eubacteriales bacterium]|nr:glycosyltransferase family 4 protein [Eubacteriales bacterium]